MINHIMVPVRTEDIPAVKQLVDRTISVSYRDLYEPCARQWFCHYHSRRAMARELKAGSLMLAVWQDGRPVATATLHRGEIKRVFVDPGCQRQGLGRILMDRMEDEARSRGLHRVFLYSTPDSHRYYRGRGYETLSAAADDIAGTALPYYYEQKWLTPVAPITIGPASDADAGEYCLRQVGAFRPVAAQYRDEIPPVRETPEDIRRAMTEHVVLKAVMDGRIVGGVRGMGTEPRVGHIARLFVSPGVRGRGVGSRLLYEAERAMADREIFELFTGDRSRRNLRIYRHAGYEAVRREPCGEYELVYMRKRNPIVVREVKP